MDLSCNSIVTIDYGSQFETTYEYTMIVSAGKIRPSKHLPNSTIGDESPLGTSHSIADWVVLQ